MSDHVFGDGHVVIDFPIVDLEFEADEVGKDCGCASHCFDRFDGFAGLGTDYGEARLKAGLGDGGGNRWIPC